MSAVVHDSNKSKALRPFFFVMVVWGDEYRNYFLEYCLPSLLAPHNIPAVSKCRPAKYLIATTANDWELMKRTAIFRELAHNVVPTFIELPPCPSDRPYWMQNIIGHKLCCDLVFQEKAYRIFTSPDAMFADGAITRMHDLALSGAEVVMKLTVPQADKTAFFKTLTHMNLLPESSARDTGKSLIFSGRQLASATIRSMHSMSIVNEWRASYFCGYASTPWWRVPVREEGIVACGLRWDVLLLDYAAVNSHDSSILDERGWDGDYIMRTFGHLETMYIVRDSDDIMLGGWASDPEVRTRPHILGDLSKGVSFRKSYYSDSFNSLHRGLLLFPTRIHSGPLSETWDQVESQALRTLLKWVEPPLNLFKISRRLPLALNTCAELEAKIARLRAPRWRRALLAVGCGLLYPATLHLQTIGVRYCASSLNSLLRFYETGRIVARRIGLILGRNEGALRWWRWRLRKLMARARGQPFNEPRPESQN
jgi:hypothetical protein